MSTGFANVGLTWTAAEFAAYLAKVQRPAWAKAVCVHHTASPSLAQRPAGITAQHIRNIRDFYRDEKGWSAGPHLFVDDRQILGMTPLVQPGVHARSFNASAIGIEVLGDYDIESPFTGRGQIAWRHAAIATRALLDWLQLPATEHTVLFHRDDPKTTKTCPGTLVQKPWFLALLKQP